MPGMSTEEAERVSTALRARVLTGLRGAITPWSSSCFKLACGSLTALAVLAQHSQVSRSCALAEPQ